MTEPHVYNEEGVEWQRIWWSPRADVDTKLDPFSSKDFVNKTNKKDSVGNLFDRAQELSQKRAEKEGGKDPFQKTWFNNYAKKRQGKRHPLDN